VLTKRRDDIFKTVFEARASQIIGVFNVQACCSGRRSVADDIGAFMTSAYGSLSGGSTHGDIDSYAIASYVDPYDNSSCPADVPTTLSAMNTSVAVGGTVYGWVSTDLDTANKYSIPLITYEGGQGLSYFAGRFSVEMSAQFDPGMFTVYNNNFAMCTAINAATLPYLHLGTAGF
jgi:hypothetical protein